jgi:surface antigen
MPMRRTLRRALLLPLLGLAIGTAMPLAWAAAGWGAVLRDGPIEDFHDEDLRLYLDAIRKTLETPGAQPVEWRNEASGAGGSLSVLGEPKLQGYAECRRVRSTLYSKKRQGLPSVWTACREAGGRWQLVRSD